MQIEIRVVGRIREEYLKSGIAEYQKRLQPYTRLVIREIREEAIQDERSSTLCRQARERESTQLLKGIPSGMVVIALDMEGEEWTSRELADRISSWEIAGNTGAIFLIGGPTGLHETVLSHSDFHLCLSRMTFPHQLVRLILVEQLYRAFRIMRGEPYHK